MKRSVEPKRDKRKFKNVRFFDYSLLFIIIFLVGFGLVILYSTSSYNAQNKFGDSFYYVKKQVFATSLGLLGMYIAAKIDYHFWYKMAWVAYLGALGLCGIVLVIGSNYNGSQRTIDLGFISFQPSEIAKVAMIVFLACIISKIPRKMGEFKTVLKILCMVLPVVALVAIENLSTAIIILGIAVVMIFVASPKYKQFFALAVGAVAVMAVFLLMASYRVERLKIWLHPENYDKGYQTLQGLYAIGSGGLFGKGLGASMQKLGFIPEAQNDMIFSIICEELGLLGAICVIMLFLLMLWRFMVIANNTDDLFGSLLVVGIMSHIAIQVILNIAVVTNSIPNTGITLPFISYGGTSALFLLTEMGIALSVSRGIKFENQ